MEENEGAALRNSLFETPYLAKRLIMSGGKGGVGKTTCASAIALHLAESGKRTLILSSDPTASLSDILECDLGSQMAPIPGTENLWGLELGRERVLEMWRARYGAEIYEVLSSFLPVGPEIIDYIAEAPGVVEEQFMLAYILDLLQGSDFEKIVWDTAPAGQTLSLLRLESRFYDHLTDAANLYARVHSYLEKLREAVKPRARRSPLDIINQWRALAHSILSALRDHQVTEFVPVTIPEALGVYQTERIIKELDTYGIGVRRIIVNCVLPRAECTSDFFLRRYEIQSKYIDSLRQRYGDSALVLVPLLPREVKGVESLREIARYL